VLELLLEERAWADGGAVLAHRALLGRADGALGRRRRTSPAAAAAERIRRDIHAVQVKRVLLACEAAAEEVFFAEHDPFGDRFGTTIPWWGCLGALAVLAAVVYAVIAWNS
jgi:hypothetical protein